MRTTDFDDDKDRVLIKSNGDLTYFASDTAYYVNKRERGFERCIYLLGADHHGYVNRLRAMAACTGDDPNHNIEVLIGQLVKILKGGEEMRLSKRAGTIVTLDELVEEIGVDALRYSLARYPADSPLTLDVEQITSASNDNPVYTVQYAHARVASLLRNAADLGIAPASHPELLVDEKEGALLRALAEFPRVVEVGGRAARAAPGRPLPRGAGRHVPPVLRQLPGAAAGRRGADRPARGAPACSSTATRTVLANGLRLLGVSAPERM